MNTVVTVLVLYSRRARIVIYSARWQQGEPALVIIVVSCNYHFSIWRLYL